MPRDGEWTAEELSEEFSDMSGVTVPVNISIEAKQRVLCLDELRKILVGADRIAVAECECRAKLGHCSAPLDVCIFLDEGADEQVEKGTGRFVTLEEALDVLRRCHEAGLVHLAMVTKGSDSVRYICSCCSCCCQCLAAMQRFGFDDVLFSSDFIAVQEGDACDDCGLCVDRCQFHARSMTDGRLAFDPAKCFGCGVCLSSCPEDAIRLVPR